MLVLNYKIDKLKAAKYNPRSIDEKDIKELESSLKKIGCIKPILVNKKNNVIVAGHQRTKALKNIGIEYAPVYFLENIKKVDEVTFNQFHNGTDCEIGSENIKINVTLQEGYNLVSWRDISCNFDVPFANVRHILMELISKYGTFGSCVATSTGKVFHSSQYVLACVILKRDVLVYKINEEIEKESKYFLSKEYGVFNYENLEKNTFIQTFAQKFRLRTNKQGSRSTLYEKVVIENITKEERGIDFGAGQGDYVKLLKSRGYNIKEMEFFRRKGNSIDVSAVYKMIENLLEDVKENGLYDYVICDSVLNSVDSLEAESAVLGTLNSLCKIGGKIFFSGRPIDVCERSYRSKRKTDKSRKLNFLDKNGFTSIYKKGEWFYQKFHTREQLDKLCKDNNFINVKYHKFINDSFQIKAIKEKHLEEKQLEESVKFEFNLKYNRTDSYNKGQEAYEILKKSQEVKI